MLKARRKMKGMDGKGKVLIPKKLQLQKPQIHIVTKMADCASNHSYNFTPLQLACVVFVALLVILLFIILVLEIGHLLKLKSEKG